MTTRLGTTLRNARLNTVESTVGPNPRLRVYTGSEPASAGAAATGTLLVDTTLPSDWLAAASGGVATLLGSWSSTAVGAGTVGYYRIWDSAVSVCHIQGSATASGGGGDMQFDNAVIAVGQTVNVTAYTLTEGNP